MAEITRVLAAAGATEIRVSKDEARAPAALVGPQGGVSRGRPHLARLLLHRRHDPAPRAARACCAQIEALVASEYGLRCANVFHAGDGNLHPLILFDANKPGEIGADRWRSATASSSCASRSAARSPASTAWASRSCRRCACSSGAAELDALPRASRRRSTPQSPAQSGQGRADAARCAEFGKMHVHHGQLPHPELPRF